MIDFDKIDKIIHEKGRLSIMTLLASRSSWSFQDMKDQLKMSDGNLITHLRSLQKAGYLDKKKELKGRKVTYYFITSSGKKAFNQYLKILEQIVNQSE
ncbi:MAG: transcriptional regulator [Verrucomicrobiota bacterium]|nr:transcriptional regulator [Verrucomicrobiales bacterium]MEC9042954.1 transcriptional regulator [Verrucomicrobiota bacterium]MEE2724569.1 transcriptional regulator [Verrucomicrobiota bacterium]|tara:strand:- start:424 stop:717 length:294 start_codon:yes stop_codon:yes gene_type:complete